jgi:uncharacterized DUF497 family protein
VRFIWDRQKSGANLVKRGFDFAFAELIFDSPTLERPDDRQDYGELRVIALGIADEIPLTVIYTDRAESGGEVVRRIISARVSSRRERKAFNQAFKKEG